MISNYINYNKAQLFRQGFRKKILAALLYAMFLPLLLGWTSPFRKRLHQMMYKALNHSKFSGRDYLQSFVIEAFTHDFQEWLWKSKAHYSRRSLMMRIDSSKLGFHYGKFLPEADWLYDYVKRSHKLTHKALNVMKLR